MRGPITWAAAALLVVGGFLLFLGGLLFAFFGAVFLLVGLPGELLFTGLAIAGLVWLMALLLWLVPRGHVIWGAGAILLALASLLFNALEGFVVGFFVVLAGGLLAILRPGEL